MSTQQSLNNSSNLNCFKKLKQDALISSPERHFRRRPNFYLDKVTCSGKEVFAGIAENHKGWIDEDQHKYIVDGILRPVIKPGCMPILGCVLLQHGLRGIVVDDPDENADFKKFLDEVKNRVKGKSDENDVLMEIKNLIPQFFRLSDVRSMVSISRDFFFPKKPRITKLSRFLQIILDHGLCGWIEIHALAAAAVIEYCIRENILEGQCGVDANVICLGNYLHEWHFWAEFLSNKSGKLYVVDPYLGYVGSFGDENAPWPYTPVDYLPNDNDSNSEK